MLFAEDAKSGIKIVAGIVEIIAGWFGFLGVGHFILGDSNGGKKKMGQWAIAIFVGLVISIVSGGAAFALAESQNATSRGFGPR